MTLLKNSFAVPTTFFLLVLLASSNLCAQDSKQNKPDKPEDKLFWIFLTTGKKSSSDYKREEIEEMQKKHLDNFKRLANAGKLLVAGPMADPNKKLRGIVVLKMKDTSRLTEMFKPDPFVSNGLMDIDICPAELVHGKVNLKGLDDGFDELRLVAFGKKKKKSKELKSVTKKQAEFVKKEHQAKRLRCAVTTDSEHWHQVLLEV